MWKVLCKTADGKLVDQVQFTSRRRAAEYLRSLNSTWITRDQANSTYTVRV